MKASTGVLFHIVQMNQLLIPLPVLKWSLTSKGEHPSQGYGLGSELWSSSKNTEVEDVFQMRCSAAVNEALGCVRGCEGSLPPHCCRIAHKRAGAACQLFDSLVFPQPLLAFCFPKWVRSAWNLLDRGWEELPNDVQNCELNIFIAT